MGDYDDEHWAVFGARIVAVQKGIIYKPNFSATTRSRSEWQRCAYVYTCIYSPYQET